MKVIPELSKNAWKALLVLSDRLQPAAEIAKQSGLSLSRVSEALNQLEKFKILTSRKRRKPLAIDASLRNSLRNLLLNYSKERLAEALEGKKLNVLFQVLEGYDTSEKLKSATGYSASTLKRAVKKLQDGLFIYQPKKGVYRVRDEISPQTRQLYEAFFACFLDSLEDQKITWKDIKTFGTIILVKSTQESLPGFVKTGFSLFHLYGVDIIETSENYFTNLSRAPTKEEVFIHALVFSLKEHRNMILCMIFADLNKLSGMKRLSMIYRTEKEVAAIFDFLKTNGKQRADFLPTYEEYLSVRRDYGRT